MRMKSKFIWFVLLGLLLACPPKVQAQVSAGVYGGFTTPTPSVFTGMVMADFGTALDVEPWAQSYGRLVQFGVDVIATPKGLKGFGATVGIYSNTRTERVGLTYTKGNGQLRVLRATGGLWQGIGYYNFNLPHKNYLQLWAAPAQGGSSWLVGIGHTFKD